MWMGPREMSKHGSASPRPNRCITSSPHQPSAALFPFQSHATEHRPCYFLVLVEQFCGHQERAGKGMVTADMELLATWAALERPRELQAGTSSGMLPPLPPQPTRSFHFLTHVQVVSSSQARCFCCTALTWRTPPAVMAAGAQVPWNTPTQYIP
ncbi:hypothetical protein DHEL01_v208684 [Diaporthe helianthi]|uniref:Uncharacterized protein n=1 Tax=Diaporthe helianthi TaxID=158607 RepID=A0A2P5HRP5_DIAHE|nr:hypothetical protein DHEL01_v208684 [Diaporthe helianthi]